MNANNHLKEGDTVYVAKDIFSTLRAKLRIHFYHELPHTAENLDELIGIINEIEKQYKQKDCMK